MGVHEARSGRQLANALADRPQSRGQRARWDGLNPIGPGLAGSDDHSPRRRPAFLEREHEIVYVTVEATGVLWERFGADQQRPEDAFRRALLGTRSVRSWQGSDW